VGSLRLVGLASGGAGKTHRPVWANVTTMFAIALVAVLVAAGGLWLIVAVPVAVLVLLPAALFGLRGQFEAATRLRRELERRHADEAERFGASPLGHE
jgi:di/tricarboxylate transporter